MKKLTLILIFFLPTLLFSQSKSDSLSQTIHIKKTDTNTILSSQVNNNNDTTKIILYSKNRIDTVTLSTLLNSPLDSILRCEDTAKVISFSFSALYMGGTYLNNPGHFKHESASLLYNSPKWDVFIIDNILYKTLNGKTNIMQPIRLDFPEYYYIFTEGTFKAILSGKFQGNTQAMVSDILDNTKLTLLGCGDSAKITGFSIGISISGVFTFYHIRGNSLSKEVISKLNQTSNGDLIKIRDVEYTLKGLNYISNEIVIRLYK